MPHVNIISHFHAQIKKKVQKEKNYFAQSFQLRDVHMKKKTYYYIDDPRVTTDAERFYGTEKSLEKLREIFNLDMTHGGFDNKQRVLNNNY